MEAMIGEVLENIQIGELQTHKNMTVAPLVFPAAEGIPYLTLSQGFERHVLAVQEISEGGSVPELSVVNRGDMHVLLLDGEEIRGAKQNRVLNTSILVAPMAKCIIPVSCTEQGRWNYTSRTFEDSGVLMARSIRSQKQASVSRNIRDSRSYCSDQGEVWEQVRALHEDLGTTSSTGAMRDAYELRKADLDEYAQAFAGLRDINGLAIFLGGDLVGVDYISYAPAMNDLLPKLISSYAMDALRIQSSGKIEKPGRRAVEQFFEEVGRCTLEAHPSRGVGVDARLDGPDHQGAALIAFETVVHLAVFAKTQQQTSRTGMSSFSRRRNFKFTR